jgi:hypothetical protein
MPALGFVEATESVFPFPKMGANYFLFLKEEWY